MANKRIIHAKYKTSPEWLRLSYLQQALVYGLLLETDDDGIVTLFNSLDRIAPSCEKFSTKKFEDGLKALEVQRFIHVYTVDGFRYVQFRRWWNDQKLDRYQVTRHPKSEYYLEKTMQLEKSSNRNYYDERDKPSSNVATMSRQSSEQQELNNKENLNPTPTVTQAKEEEWAGYKDLIRFLRKKEKEGRVNTPEAYAASLMKKYPKSVILHALHYSPTESLPDFYKTCDAKMNAKQQRHESN